MSRILLTLTIALSLGCLLAACETTEEECEAGGLDTNGDGKLDAADVDEGDAGIWASFVDADGEEVEIGTWATDANIMYMGDGVYNLQITFDNDASYVLDLRFDGMSPMETGDHPVAFATLTQDESSFYAYDSDPTGNVVISDTDGEVASGHFEGEILLEAIDQTEQPTGETVEILGFAFNSVPVSYPQ